MNNNTEYSTNTIYNGIGMACMIQSSCSILCILTMTFSCPREAKNTPVTTSCGSKTSRILLRNTLVTTNPKYTVKEFPVISISIEKRLHPLLPPEVTSRIPAEYIITINQYLYHRDTAHTLPMYGSGRQYHNAKRSLWILDHTIPPFHVLDVKIVEHHIIPIPTIAQKIRKHSSNCNVTNVKMAYRVKIANGNVLIVLLPSTLDDI